MHNLNRRVNQDTIFFVKKLGSDTDLLVLLYFIYFSKFSTLVYLVILCFIVFSFQYFLISGSYCGLELSLTSSNCCYRKLFYVFAQHKYKCWCCTFSVVFLCNFDSLIQSHNSLRFNSHTTTVPLYLLNNFMILWPLLIPIPSLLQLSVSTLSHDSPLMFISFSIETGSITFNGFRKENWWNCLEKCFHYVNIKNGCIYLLKQ